MTGSTLMSVDWLGLKLYPLGAHAGVDALEAKAIMGSPMELLHRAALTY
jgi:hypothetical protein